MMTKRKFSGRIVRRQRKQYQAITLSVCHHIKDRISGSPTHLQLFAVPSFKSTDVNNEDVRKLVWDAIDEGCKKLMIRNGMTNAARTEIQRKFETVIKRPSKVAARSTPPTASNPSSSLRDRFPILNS